MAKTKKSNQESQLLELLKTVLPKAINDPKMVEIIYTACAREINSKNRVIAFEDFCKTTQVPDLKEASLAQVQKQFEDTFGKGAVTVEPIEGKQAVAVEVRLPEGSFEGVVKVGEATEADADEMSEEEKAKMIPFPVCLPGDTELIWMMGRDERMTPDEAVIALSKAQEGYWESKGGQKSLRDRVERSFPEFMNRVPSKMLGEVGLKRHYKDPEPIKELVPIKPRKRE